MRLADYLDRGAFLNPQGKCFVTDEQEMTFQEVQKLSHRIANGLVGAGMRKGSKIAVLSPNDPFAFTCVLGLSRLAAVWVPINPRNGLEENRYVFDHFDCVGLFYHSHFSSIVQALRDRLPQLTFFVCIDRPCQGDPALTDWMARQADQFPPVAVQPDDLCILAGTGGTTGQPKGVMLTYQNIETFVALTLICAPYDTPPVYLALAPLTHAAGVFTFPILALGGTTIIMPAPSLDAFLDHIQQHNVTTTFLPPTLIYRLLEHPEIRKTDFTSLRYFWYGAAPMSRHKLMQAIDIIGPVMIQFFGQTEAPMLISCLSPGEHFTTAGQVAMERLLSCGRPTPLVQVDIIDDEGNAVNRGTHGEIIVRSSLVMAGYYKDQAATEAALTGGWLRTGDIGYLDEDGYLYIVDRKKDMIITGGFNVFSAEVENVVLQYPGVQDCAVVGIPDEKWGEMVIAAVQPALDQHVEPQALIDHCKQKIGSVKAPKRIVICDQLPRSPVGKVLKRQIRKDILGDSRPFHKN